MDEPTLMHERLLTWDIRPGDAVIVIGGYQGATCEMILERYPECRLYTWEPQAGMFSILTATLAKQPNANAQAYPYALGVENGTFPMTLTGNDECSFVLGFANRDLPPPDSQGEMREFGEVMDSLGIEEVAWLHLNIEGYEYLLLPHLIRTGWMEKIGQVVVATHSFPRDEPRASSIEDIFKMMEQTHKLWWWHRQFIAWSRPDREAVDLA